MEWELDGGKYSGVEIHQAGKAHRVGGHRVKAQSVMLQMQRKVTREAADSELQRLYYEVCNETSGQSDKGTYHSYIAFYAGFMRKDASILEIGATPASMALWRRYFTGDVVAIDIARYGAPPDGVLFIQADATAEVAGMDGMMFDYIVDDASHVISDQIATFELMYPRLKPGGSYLIEDIQDLEAFREQFPRGVVHDLRAERTFAPDNIIIEIGKEVS